MQVSLNSPVINEVTIRIHPQKMVYEGEGILCLNFGRLGHTTPKCSLMAQKNQKGKASTGTITDGGWEVVHFPKKKTQAEKGHLNSEKIDHNDTVDPVSPMTNPNKPQPRRPKSINRFRPTSPSPNEEADPSLEQNTTLLNRT